MQEKQGRANPKKAADAQVRSPWPEFCSALQRYDDVGELYIYLFIGTALVSFYSHFMAQF